MALDLKTPAQVNQLLRNALVQSINVGQTDINKKIDPTIRNSFIKGLVDSLTAGIDDNNRNIRKTEQELFPATATEQGFLIDWGVLFDINQNSAAAAIGNILFSGTAGGVIPAGTLLQRANGIQYATQTETTIGQVTINVDSITRSGSTVTVTTASNHNLASNFVIDSIQGANETDYNVVDATITVTGLNTLTYEISTTPATPATGAITLTYTGALTNIKATTQGADTNSEEGAQLNLVTPLANVDDTAIVTFEGLFGGLDLEDIESLRSRINERTANLVNVFAKKGLEIFIKENVDGVTRVFVQDSFAPTKSVELDSLSSDADGVATANVTPAITDFINGSPISITGANEIDLNVTKKIAIQKINGDIIFNLDIESAFVGTGTIDISYSTVPAGRVVIYFVRDGDINIIPSGQQVQDVKNAIIDPDNEVKPANTPDSFVIVKAPTGVSVDVTFSGLNPNSEDMQSAITQSLDSYFRNDTSVGKNIGLNELENVIFATTDSAGNSPQFTLSSPAADIVIDDGEIATLGTITYP
jgi:uncharacterized phage protein gp47/JayE